MKDWRTTAAGVILGLGIILTQFGGLLDADPNTVFDMTKAMGGLAMIAGAVGLGYFAQSIK